MGALQCTLCRCARRPRRILTRAGPVGAAEGPCLRVIRRRSRRPTQAASLSDAAVAVATRQCCWLLGTGARWSTLKSAWFAVSSSPSLLALWVALVRCWSDIPSRRSKPGCRRVSSLRGQDFEV